MGSRSKPSLKDIAAKAGVAISTVSRVLQKNKNISQKTADHVLEIARMLGYEKQESIKKKMKYLIYMPHKLSWENPFFIQSLIGIEHECKKQGYQLFIEIIHEEENWIATIRDTIEHIDAAGLILSTVLSTNSVIHSLKETEIPFVVIGRPQDQSGVFWVDNDNVQSSYEVTNQLVNEGMRRLCFVNWDNDFHVSVDREEGFTRALKRRGFSSDSINIIHLGENQSLAELDSLIKWNQIDAIVACDDLLALEVLNLSEEKGLTIRVVGFNNTYASHMRGRNLSTVDIQSEELGKWAAKLLIDQLEGQNSLMNRIVPSRFIIRDT